MDNNINNSVTTVPAERRRRTPEEIARRKAAQKRRQIMHYIMLGLCLLTLIMEISALVALCRLGMLPGFLVILIVVVFLGYDGLIGYFMFLRGKKVPKKQAKKEAKKRRLIACVLALVMICGCIAISTVANDVRKTIESVQADPIVEAEEVGITRSVYVRSFDAAQTLEEAAAYSYGILSGYDDECTQQAVTAIETQLGSKINTKSYLSVFEMANDLMAGHLDAMILKSGFISILEGDSRYEMFSDNTRVLADVQIEGSSEELDGSGLLLNTEADIAENGKLKPFIAYISGSDSRQGILDGNTRSDVNILAVVNPETRQVLLLNTPRDYYVPINRAEGAYDKLTHCGVYGIKCSMDALAALYNCEVKYYAQVNFEGFEKLVDAVGGITINSKVEFDLYRNAGKIKVGENNLNGKKALAFARTRKGLAGGDNQRGKHQMEVIRAVIKKATSGTTVIKNYNKIIKSIDGMFTMSIPTKTINKMMKMQLSDMAQWNVVTYSATGTNTQAICYSMPSMKLSVVQPNSSSVKKATLLMDMVMSGEILTEEVVDGITG